MKHACLDPIVIGGCEFKNRIFFAPTTLGLKAEEKTLKLKAIATGQTALIILPDIPSQVPAACRIIGHLRLISSSSSSCTRKTARFCPAASVG
ncbi:MAG: hypothetical protein ACLSA6_19205 [Holdemania massiliensis]